MGGDVRCYGILQCEFGGCYQVFNMCSMEFVSFVYYKFQKFVVFMVGLLGSDVYYDKLIVVDFKCEVCYILLGGQYDNKKIS